MFHKCINIPGTLLAAENLPPSVKSRNNIVNQSITSVWEEICRSAFVSTFDKFSNSLWFFIDQLWVTVDGGDLSEVWAWMFKTQLDPKHRTCFISHLCSETSAYIWITSRKKEKKNMKREKNKHKKPVWYLRIVHRSPTLNDIRLADRGVPGSTFRWVLEKGVESHLKT